MEKTRNIFISIRIIAALAGLILLFVVPKLALLPIALISIEGFYVIFFNRKYAQVIDEREIQILYKAGNLTFAFGIILAVIIEMYLAPAGFDWFSTLFLGMLLVHSIYLFYMLNREK